MIQTLVGRHMESIEQIDSKHSLGELSEVGAITLMLTILVHHPAGYDVVRDFGHEIQLADRRKVYAEKREVRSVS